ncbi:MAG: D-alanine--D-alanine ligase [Chloroflexota bacterium]|nr:D-alanine--D-alanine ligase [Chloroflexota bacterium]
MSGNRRKINVMVVFGGQSGEHDVSLRSAQTVIGALDPDKYEITQIGITREGGWLVSGDPMAALTADSPLFQIGPGGGPDPEELAEHGVPAIATDQVDVVFPVLHGPMGEDGTIQGMLRLAGIPFVGSGVLGSAVAMDKAMAKLVLAQADIPQAPWLLVNRHELVNDAAGVLDRIETAYPYPVFVKPANMGSSVGVTKAHNRNELEAGLRDAARFDRRIVVEAGVVGRELEISVLGNDQPRASVAGEIRPVNEFYDYNAKYVDDGSELIIPADISPETLAEMQEIAIRAFRALDLAGLARVDFFLEEGTNRVLLNEVNTMPGFTSISMYPMLWEASGLPLHELVDMLISLALDRHAEEHGSAEA